MTNLGYNIGNITGSLASCPTPLLLCAEHGDIKSVHCQGQENTYRAPSSTVCRSRQGPMLVLIGRGANLPYLEEGAEKIGGGGKVKAANGESKGMTQREDRQCRIASRIEEGRDSPEQYGL